MRERAERARIETDPSSPRLLSPLMRRILMVNTLPLIVLAVTLLFLNQFRDSLLSAEVGALREQARIYAGAMGQSAVAPRDRQTYILEPALVRPLLLRLSEPSPGADARIYAPDGQLVADSREEKIRHRLPGSPPLPPDQQDAVPLASGRGPLNGFFSFLLGEDTTNVDFHDRPALPGTHMAPETPPYIRRTAAGTLVVTVAEPIIHDGQTVGVIQLTRTGEAIDQSLYEIRSSIFSLFLVAMAITVLLSWYLSLTIARPLLRLTASARVMRESSGRSGTVPARLLGRNDEIGTLARALQHSSQALWQRMDATERFAADVAHEIKNPLSSIRSAIETLPRIRDPGQHMRLLGIISQDVRRLDRLITDISDASRLDAELSRSHPDPVAVGPLLSLLAEIHQSTRKAGQPQIFVAVTDDTDAQPLCVLAVEDRLVQVLRNLIGNAISFSPPDGQILLEAHDDGQMTEISVSDQGPGIPETKLESIFDRFYSERPETENFGQHSGLGLSISRQIIQALRGTISAENRVGPGGDILGARFVIRLPGK
ncbi:sensor histidine kinase [Acetobacter sp. AN02]|uniref:ATP-binding protein n=1 Tax=Acetobacter sp. AN02 TaxID=2894186 RepID=UPI00243439F9|nr:ATP-binding protein [Acetobacter sp. AN02]MDG6094827.1 sensor histidine kinase [Acetobacter sp. AN02]